MTQTPNIKKGDSVKLPDGTIHEISSIQYVHDRYQLLGVSNWQYGINDLVITRPQSAYFYWLQEAKERGEREKRMKEVMADTIAEPELWADPKNGLEVVIRCLKDLLSTLYPDTPAPEEGDNQ